MRGGFLHKPFAHREILAAEKLNFADSTDLIPAQKSHHDLVMLFRMLPLRPVRGIRHATKSRPWYQGAHVLTDIGTGAGVFIRP
jgi:hypothetical protein